MTDDTTPTDDPSDEQLRAIVREELDAMASDTMAELPVTRREFLAGLSLLGAGAVAGMGVEEIGLVGKAAAQAQPEGTIGTSSEPIDTIYVGTLKQSPSDVNADVLHVGGNQLTIGGSPSSPEAGDVRITEDTS